MSYSTVMTDGTLTESSAEDRCSPFRYTVNNIGILSSSYGYGSIPINTIFNGMNIHLPAILMFTRGTRFWHTAISSSYHHEWWNIGSLMVFAGFFEGTSAEFGNGLLLLLLHSMFFRLFCISFLVGLSATLSHYGRVCTFFILPVIKH